MCLTSKWFILCIYTHTYKRTYINTCIHTYIYIGLEIDGFALLNTFGVIANHFDQPIRNSFGQCETLLANCESLLQMDLQKNLFWSSPLF